MRALICLNCLQSIPCILLRDWVELNGWQNLKARLLENEKWANKAFYFNDSDPLYTQVLHFYISFWFFIIRLSLALRERFFELLQLFDRSDAERKLLVAEWCFSITYDELARLPSNEFRKEYPTMDFPVEGEQFPYMACNCVETLLSFYPLGYFMLFKPLAVDDTEDDMNVPCFHPVMKSIDHLHSKSSTEPGISILTSCPDDYEVIVVARQANSTVKKFQLVYSGLTCNHSRKYGR